MPNQEEQSNQQDGVITVNKEKNVVKSWDEYNSSDLPLIAAIPEKSIFLYGRKPTGVELFIEGRYHSYNWEYLTTRFILPRMEISDFDSDGKDELAVILYVGAGTQYSVEELHIVEIIGDKSFSDCCYQSNTYKSQLNELVKLKYGEKNGDPIALISAGNKQYLVNLKELQSTVNDRINSSNCIFGNFVRFYFKDNKLSGRFGLETRSEKYQRQVVLGAIYADINYNGKDFILDNLEFNPDRELLNR